MNIFKNIQLGFKRTRDALSFQIKNFFKTDSINHIFFEKLEEQLLISDFGVHTTKIIIDYLIQQNKSGILKNEDNLYDHLRYIMLSILNKHDHLIQNKSIINNNKLYIILVIGVNGVGKTTTIGKLAYFYKNLGKSVALSAADTFRAAAVDQLNFFGNKISIPVISQSFGSDPASVVFNSINFAQSNKIEILIIDTSGRLHNKKNLMEELKKIVRVIKKKNFSEPDEILLILDACNGQNSFQQTKIFNQSVKLTGIVLTKLDGTAKGGVIFSILNEFPIPIKYIGSGETVNDLIVFNSRKFIKGILKKNNI
ncbi:Signal recognition particle receptor FtsY [Buchnera aphidicola (Symydobius americanus)]